MTHVGNFLGAPVPTRIDRSAPNLARLNRPTVDTYPPSFIRFGIFCRPREAKHNLFLHIFISSSRQQYNIENNKIILPFFNFVILWWLRQVLQRQSWTRVLMYKHSSIQWYRDSLRIPKHWWPSGVQKLCHSKAWRTKTLNVFAPWRRAMAERHHTWHGVRTILAPLKHVHLRRIVSPLGGAENLG